MILRTVVQNLFHLMSLTDSTKSEKDIVFCCIHYRFIPLAILVYNLLQSVFVAKCWIVVVVVNVTHFFSGAQFLLNVLKGLKMLFSWVVGTATNVQNTFWLSAPSLALWKTPRNFKDQIGANLALSIYWHYYTLKQKLRVITNYVENP